MRVSRRAKLRRGVRLRKDAVRGVTLLLAPDRGLVLSSTAAAILELCDGELDARAIARSLSKRFSGALDAIERDVDHTLCALHASGYLEWSEP